MLVSPLRLFSRSALVYYGNANWKPATLAKWSAKRAEKEAFEAAIIPPIPYPLDGFAAFSKELEPQAKAIYKNSSSGKRLFCLDHWTKLTLEQRKIYEPNPRLLVEYKSTILDWYYKLSPEQQAGAVKAGNIWDEWVMTPTELADRRKTEEKERKREEERKKQEKEKLSQSGEKSSEDFVYSRAWLARSRT